MSKRAGNVGASDSGGGGGGDFAGYVETVEGPAVDSTDPAHPEVQAQVVSVVAGDNVNVDDTDPLNPIISALGGTAAAATNVRALAYTTTPQTVGDQAWPPVSLDLSDGAEFDPLGMISTTGGVTIITVPVDGPYLVWGFVQGDADTDVNLSGWFKKNGSVTGDLDVTASGWDLGNAGGPSPPTSRPFAIAELVAGDTIELSAYQENGGASFDVTKAMLGAILLATPPSPSVDDPLNWGTDLGYDAEFDGSGASLPAGWSWINQGGATYEEAWGAGKIVAPASATDVLRGIVQAYPSESSWVLTAKVGWIGGAANFCGAGLVIRDSTSGKLVTLTYDQTPGYLGVYAWTNETTYSTGPANVQFIPTNFEYLRITKHSATDFDFEVSADGVAWASVLEGYDLSAFLTAPDQIGVITYVANNVKLEAACHWFRIR